MGDTMSWSRRSRRHVNHRLWYLCIFCISLVLVTNFALLNRNLNGIEDENMVDPGGTKENFQDSNSIRSHKERGSNSLVSDFRDEQGLDKRLRRLMQKSSEANVRAYTINMFNHGLSLPSASEAMLTCDDAVNITDRVYLSSGWTKAVYSGKYKGKSIAVKTVDMRGQDVSTCLAKGYTIAFCYSKAAQKIVKEITVLRALSHPNLVKVLGFCIPNSRTKKVGILMVTELGEPVNLIKLLQTSWEDRLRLCHDLTKILRYMTNTPLGSMAMNDFRRQQFVLVNGTLKLSDVDDVSFGDPSCTYRGQCNIQFTSPNVTHRLRCIREKCYQYNEKRNQLNAARHFITYLLPHGAPKNLRRLVNLTIDGFANLTMNMQQVASSMDAIVRLYVTGAYLNRTNRTQRYRRYDQQDLPGLYDYRCRMTLSDSGCTLSVFDQLEAEDMCDLDTDCKGFVMSKDRTWSGRLLAHFKYGFTQPSFNKDTVLYIRQD